MPDNQNSSQNQITPQTINLGKSGGGNATTTNTPKPVKPSPKQQIVNKVKKQQTGGTTKNQGTTTKTQPTPKAPPKAAPSAQQKQQLPQPQPQSQPTQQQPPLANNNWASPPNFGGGMMGGGTPGGNTFGANNGFGNTMGGEFGQTDSNQPGQPPKRLTPEERVQMIERVYLEILNRKPDTRDINYYKYSTLDEEQIKKQLITSAEHKELLKKGREYKKIKGEAEQTKSRVKMLESQIKDQLEEFKQLNILLQEKNRYIQKLRAGKVAVYQNHSTIQQRGEQTNGITETKSNPPVEPIPEPAISHPQPEPTAEQAQPKPDNAPAPTSDPAPQPIPTTPEPQPQKFTPKQPEAETIEPTPTETAQPNPSPTNEQPTLKPPPIPVGSFANGPGGDTTNQTTPREKKIGDKILDGMKRIITGIF